MLDLSSGANETAESVQDLYDSIETDLRKAWGPRRRTTEDEKSGDENKDKSDGAAAGSGGGGGGEDPEDRISEAMERVEKCITEVFYDQLSLTLPFCRISYLYSTSGHEHLRLPLDFYSN